MDLHSAAVYAPDRPQPRPYVMFQTRPVEDRSVKAADGVSQFRDESFAIVRAPGSKDSMERVAQEWLNSLDIYARDGRIPPTWPAEYRDAFERWKKGEEVPVIGTAIKTWPPLTPAQRLNVLHAEVLTVEDLAAANDGTKARIGMGALTLVQMAKQWLEEGKTKGVTAKELAAAQIALSEAVATINELSMKVKALEVAAKAK